MQNLLCRQLYVLCVLMALDHTVGIAYRFYCCKSLQAIIVGPSALHDISVIIL